MASVYSDEYQRVIAALKQARKAQGVTQMQLAEALGRPQSFIAKIESGEMNPDTFRKGIEVYAAQITGELLQVQVSVADGERIPCPKCQ